MPGRPRRIDKRTGRFVRKAPTYYIARECPKCKKISYGTRERAQQQADIIGAEVEAKMYVYWCSYAHVWHLSSRQYR